MKKLRSLIVGALLVLPVLALDASTLAEDPVIEGLSSPQPLTGYCWIYVNGRWYVVPC